MFVLLAVVLGLIVQHTSTATYTCSCECPYGLNEGIAYATEDSAKACVQACKAIPSNPCDDTNTYACLGTNCAYSHLYNHSITTMATQYTCSCECPSGSNEGIAYTTENSAEACVQACKAILSNPCDDTNTYACLGANCTYSDLYNHSIIAMSIQDACSCQCPDGSSREVAYAISGSAQACMEACNATLEINGNEENTTLESIIDEVNFATDDTAPDTTTEKYGFSFSINGVKFGANRENPNLTHPNDIKVLAYYRHALNRYMEGNETNFERIQTLTRRHLLKTRRWTIADVERFLQWNWIPRNKCGFRLAGQPLRVSVPSDGNIYAGVEGISFHENGSFWLNLVKAESQNALFNSDDIELIMKHGITGASLALTTPIGSDDLPHPFLNASWAPYNTLIDTDFLNTLLHADIWLKSISLRAEMSARSPFRSQPINQSTFAAQSSDLCQRLFPKDNLKEDEVHSSTHIWIESGLMNYNRIIENGTVTYFLGPANMQVKYKSLMRQVKNNVTGLIDTYIGGSSPYHEHLTETATKNYNELGQSFPELLRLAELSKLMAISLLFQHHYGALRKRIVPPTTESVAQILNSSNLRGQVFRGVWPLATDERVENILDERIVNQGLKLSDKYTIRNLIAARAYIRQELIDLEKKKIKEVAEAIGEEFNISIDVISNAAISSYLTNAHPNAEDALLNEIVSGITNRINSSPSTATSLYVAMSQSGYDVGNRSNASPEVTQVTYETKSMNGTQIERPPSGYYIPRIVLRTLQDDGTYRPAQGAINLRIGLMLNNNLTSTETSKREISQYYPRANSISDHDATNKTVSYKNTHSKTELRKAYNQRIKAAQFYCHPLQKEKYGINDKLLHKIVTSIFYHIGVLVTTADGQKFLIQKESINGFNSNTILEREDTMSSKWYPVGDEITVNSTVKLGNLVDAGDNNYCLLFDNCQHLSNKIRKELCKQKKEN